jgi:hypothetical protein
MSALGQKRTSARLFDHLVGAQASVNSGPKQAKLGRSPPANSETKRRGTPVVTASPCPHTPQIEGACETIYPATLATGTSMTMSQRRHRKTDRRQFPIDLRQCRTIDGVSLDEESRRH